MDLVRFLYGASRSTVFGLMLASVTSGAASAALIALIHRALSPGEFDIGLIAAGFALARSEERRVGKEC